MGIIKRSSATSLVGWFILAAALLSAISVTAYAVTRSGAPKPPKSSLASALHRAATAPPITGVTAQFTVDQHLLTGTSTTLSSNPLLAGATGKVWYGDGRARLVVKSQLGTTAIAYDGSRVTVYDKKTHVAYVLPVKHHTAPTDASAHHAPPSVADINHALAKAARVALISGAIPGNIAGREAYSVHISPRRNGGLVGELDLAWDAARGVPLRIALYPRGSSTAAISITVTHIHFGPVAAAALAVNPPAGTKIVRVHRPTRTAHSAKADRAHTAPVTGAAAVSNAVGFPVAAPATLAGLPQDEVRSVDLGPHQAALVTYGHGLGTVFLLEQHMTARKSSLSSLPSASIDGIRGRELDTTLGSLVQWSRGGVTYTIAGSQSAARIMSAAQSLA
jgi:outer membrane lipoprotein-sorting protein